MQSETQQAQEFQRITGATQETMALYSEWKNILSHWNKKINLVSPAAISEYWLRHALDSHQLSSFLPPLNNKEGKTSPLSILGPLSILDMGSGGGFPGLSLAIAIRDRQDAQIVLVEANGKKCNFLRAVIRALKLPAKVIQERAENADTIKQRASIFGINNFNVITARAFAPLPELLGYSAPFWSPNTKGIFPKGEHWMDEVEQAKKQWQFDCEIKGSQTNEAAKILLVSALERRVGS